MTLCKKKEPILMNFNALSLRLKLILVMAGALMLVGLPMIYWGYHDTYDSTLEAHTQKFRNIGRIIDESLQTTYLNSQTLIVEKVAIEKSDMIEGIRIIDEALSSNQYDYLKNVVQYLADGWDAHVAVIDRQGRYVISSSEVVKDVIRQNLTDYLNIELAEYFRLARKNVDRNYIAFFRIPNPQGRDLPILVGLRHTGEHCIVYIQVTDYLEDTLAQREQVVRDHVVDVVRSLELDDAVSLMVLSGDGEMIAGRGPGAFTDTFGYHPEVYEKARKDGIAAGELIHNRVGKLYTIRYFKPYDWYIQASVPLSTIAEPARDYAVQMAAFILGIFSLVTVAVARWMRRFLRPLKQLSAAVKSLETVNFKSSTLADELHGLVKDLPLQSEDEVGQVAVAFNRMTVAMEKNIDDLKHSVARQHSIEGELNAARDIQQGMLPPADRDFMTDGFDAAAVMQAAKEVGGDFYEILDTPDGRKALVLGDVSGKGVSAALLMAMSLTLVKNAIRQGLEPGAILKQVNDDLAANNPNCMFVTLSFGFFDPKTGELVYSNGGHCPPVLLSTNEADSVQWLRTVNGPLVGVLDMAQFTQSQTRLDHGDICLIYSDGVSEAMNKDRVLFGEKPMQDALSVCQDLSPKAILQALLQTIQLHRQDYEQSDDITMLVFKRTKGE